MNEPDTPRAAPAAAAPTPQPAHPGAPAPDKPDTVNKFLVGASLGDRPHVFIQRPPAQWQRLTQDDALLLAAWLVALADPGRARFDAVLAAVLNA